MVFSLVSILFLPMIVCVEHTGLDLFTAVKKQLFYKSKISFLKAVGVAIRTELEFRTEHRRFLPHFSKKRSKSVNLIVELTLFSDHHWVDLVRLNFPNWQKWIVWKSHDRLFVGHFPIQISILQLNWLWKVLSFCVYKDIGD